MQPLTVGKTSCHFVESENWLKICRQWLRNENFHHIVTLNPEMVMLTEKDEKFRKMLSQANLRVPDGAGLIWARWYLRSRYWLWLPSLFAFLLQPVERITGVNAIDQLSHLCAEENKPVYLLGGNKNNAEAVARKMKKKYPQLKIITSPEHQYNENGPEHIIKDIKKHQPAVIFAAYGAPKQTVWLEKQRFKLAENNVKIGIGVGGAFDILSEQLPRAPRFLRKANLEWLWRLYLEPSRAPRIWQAVIKFPLLIRKQKLNSYRLK